MTRETEILLLRFMRLQTWAMLEIVPQVRLGSALQKGLYDLDGDLCRETGVYHLLRDDAHPPAQTQPTGDDQAKGPVSEDSESPTTRPNYFCQLDGIGPQQKPSAGPICTFCEEGNHCSPAYDARVQKCACSCHEFRTELRHTLGMSR